MSIDLRNLGLLTANLRDNLTKCAQEPDVDSVHDTRTGTRRIEAALETLLRETSSVKGDGLLEAVHSWLRLLKKIRRAAAPVRDLDVHRKLLEKLVKPQKDPAGQDRRPARSLGTSDADFSTLSTSPEELLVQQAGDLDAWLKHQRQNHTSPLKKNAAGWAGKLEKRLAALEAVLSQRTAMRRRPKRPSAAALDSFALLASQMQLLDALNLHDFRKGAKKARYVAESGGEDEGAKVVGGALKKLQDEIGDWHDWVMLAEEAHSALGDQADELIARIETERDQHYSSAMKMAGRLRGRLMGEWLSRTRPFGTPRTARPGIRVV